MQTYLFFEFLYQCLSSFIMVTLDQLCFINKNVNDRRQLIILNTGKGMYAPKQLHMRRWIFNNSILLSTTPYFSLEFSHYKVLPILFLWYILYIYIAFLTITNNNNIRRRQLLRFILRCLNSFRVVKVMQWCGIAIIFYGAGVRFSRMWHHQYLPKPRLEKLFQDNFSF